MNIIRIPTALRPYAENNREYESSAATVGEALQQLLAAYPALQPHLLDEEGELRAYVNLFINEDEASSFGGQQAPLKPGDRLLIVPSIAGGAQEPPPTLTDDPGPTSPASNPTLVDHAALKTNQALIILLLLAAFLADLAWLVLAVGLVMAIGTALARPGFLPVYRLLKSRRLVKADPIPDAPQPHRFAQGLGAAVLLAANTAFWAVLPALGWGLVWLVIALAALNLFGGFCVGCALYYWLGRMGLRGFGPQPGASAGSAGELSGE